MPDIPPIVLLAIQLGVSSLIGLVTALMLFMLGKILRDLKENTDSTHSLAVKMATVDTKVDNATTRLEVLGVRTHELSQSIVELRTINKLKGLGDD